jgi:hypothetical protein
VYLGLQIAYDEAAVCGLAQGRATDPRVRTLMRHVCDDLQGHGARLIQLSASRAAARPTSLSAGARQSLGKLSGMTGGTFDRHYLADRAQAYGVSEAACTCQAGHVSDPSLTQWAIGTADCLRGHRHRMLQLHQALYIEQPWPEPSPYPGA